MLTHKALAMGESHNGGRIHKVGDGEGLRHPLMVLRSDVNKGTSGEAHRIHLNLQKTDTETYIVNSCVISA